jgi:hypothetical protein
MAGRTTNAATRITLTIASAIVAVALVSATTGACGGEIHLASGASDASTGPSATDRDGGESAGCSSDVECGGTGGHCDTVARICVSCTADEHCGKEPARRCDVALHRCVECGVPSECRPDQTCEMTTRRCVPSCEGNRACPEDAPTCDTARGICVPCITAGSCQDPERSVCDVSGGRCVECLNDAQCERSGKRRCDRISGRCVQCLSAIDCKADGGLEPLCDLDELECVDH